MSIGKKPCPSCGGSMHRGSVICLQCRTIADLTKTPPRLVAQDRTQQRTNVELHSLRARYRDALKTIETQEGLLQAAAKLSTGGSTLAITPEHGDGTSEATAVIVASDWHIEENVGDEVGGLNVYNVAIAEARAQKFFKSALRLVKLLQQDVQIPTVVLALLGDFISNDIHDELADVSELQPIHALATVQGWLISGIEFLLNHYEGKLVIPCHSGNHARTTKTTRFSAENGHSLEYLMYQHLAAYFRAEPRVTFLIPGGIHSYLTIYDQTLRFHHGHAVKYGGGVGGIYIPVNKAIGQWNKAKHATLDVFGHFHQLRDGGNFICNGSLIGYNGFALSIKADYEKPKQALFLIDRKRGRTCLWPIFVE